ncbi:hypothetical protein [Streptomyces sp. LN245]|uniref:hypothetical protein n=1 Tax=Streptomyces sp. LN245 TaxID=3112975 RepID=UPI00371CBE04
MHTKGDGFRAWVTGLDDRTLRELLMIPGMLAHIPGIATALNGQPPRLRRREILAARTWLSRTSAGGLAAIVQHATDWTLFRLERCYGHPAEELSAPAAEHLREVLHEVDSVLAQITLYGLSDSPVADGGSVGDHWDDLWAAASTAGAPCRCERGEGACRPAAGTEDGSGAAGETTEPDATPAGRGESLTLEITDEQLFASRQVLSERSAELGGVLEETLRRVRAGQGVPGLLAVQLEEWRQVRSRIADRLAVNGREWSGEAGFAELDEIVQELRDAAAERAKELRGLNEDREGLLLLLERTASDAPHRIPLQQSLTALETRISELAAAGAPAVLPPDRALPAAIPEQARAIDPGEGPRPTTEPDADPTAERDHTPDVVPEPTVESTPVVLPTDPSDAGAGSDLDSDSQPGPGAVPDTVPTAARSPQADPATASAPVQPAEESVPAPEVKADPASEAAHVPEPVVTNRTSPLAAGAQAPLPERTDPEASGAPAAADALASIRRPRQSRPSCPGSR